MTPKSTSRRALGGALAAAALATLPGCGTAASSEPSAFRPVAAETVTADQRDTAIPPALLRMAQAEPAAVEQPPEDAAPSPEPAPEVSEPVRPTGGGGSGDFATLPPGSALPSDAECADRVRRSGFEPRPENRTANNTVPSGGTSTASWGGDGANALRERVSGDFTGTTDEIIQWASCKWGFEPDVTRAQAVQESTWVQSARGDGGVSYGLLQIKSTAWEGTLPWSRDSTAYNLDWSLGMRRACYEGHVHGEQGRGDMWGCIGSHYSGRWMDSGAAAYIERVQGHLSQRAWEDWG